MKKYASQMIALLLVCCMLLSLAACGNGGTTAGGKDDSKLSVSDTVVDNVKEEEDNTETDGNIPPVVDNVKKDEVNTEMDSNISLVVDNSKKPEKNQAQNVVDAITTLSPVCKPTRTALPILTTSRKLFSLAPRPAMPLLPKAITTQALFLLR